MNLDILPRHPNSTRLPVPPIAPANPTISSSVKTPRTRPDALSTGSRPSKKVVILALRRSLVLPRQRISGPQSRDDSVTISASFRPARVSCLENLTIPTRHNIIWRSYAVTLTFVRDLTRPGQTSDPARSLCAQDSRTAMKRTEWVGYLRQGLVLAEHWASA